MAAPLCSLLSRLQERKTVNQVREEVAELPWAGAADLLHHCLQDVNFGIGSYRVLRSSQCNTKKGALMWQY
jgi:hypothetical protein